MKDLKKYLTEGLLQFTILLSLAGVRVDLDWYLPPVREIIQGSSSAYSQIPFHSLRDTWGGPSLHPKSPDLDSFFTARRLLCEVRSLGDPRIPRTELSAWLVHAVSGDAEPAHTLPTAQPTEHTDSSFGTPSEEPVQPPARDSSPQTGTRATSSPAAQTGTRATSSPAQTGTTATSSPAQTGTTATSSPAQTGTRATSSPAQTGTTATSSPADYTKEAQEEELGSSPNSGYSFLQNEQGKNRLEEDLPPPNREEESTHGVTSDVDLTNGNDHVETEIRRNPAEPFLFEEFIQLLAQTENAPEGTNENTLLSTNANFRMSSGHSMGELWQDFLSLPDLNVTLEDIQPVNNINSVNPSTQYSVDFTEAISQNVSLQEAMFLSNQTSRTHGDLTRMQASFSQLNSSSEHEGSLSASNLTALLSPMDNSTRNLTHQDLLSGLDENVFDEINLMSLALEEGFDPLEVSQLFEEPDSDSGLSLNSSHSPTYASSSDSSSVSFGDDEGATAYSSDSESLSYDGLEGAVGGNCPEANKFCRLDFQEESNGYDDVTLQNVQHNHTYNQIPSPEETVPEHHYSWPVKLRDPCPSGMDKTLSRDQRRAKSLQIPFSVDEIVTMPVEMFNNMLSKHFLTDAQVSVIRDIRRRGKNKVAAQNCRKRKLDVILNLEDDVSQLKAHKDRLLKERAQCIKSASHMKQKLNELYRDVFSRLRDEQGRAVNPSHYALHCNSDGSIMVVPRRLFKSEQNKETHKDKNQK